MNSILETALANLTSPPVLAFALGLLATALKANLRLPEPVYQAITIYLLLGIGIKGGVALSQADPSALLWPLVGSLALGVLIPVLAFYILKVLGKFSIADRGALAAHYGSTSLVTFTAALVFFESIRVPVEGFVATLLAVLEIPGIIVGLLLATRSRADSKGVKESLLEVVQGKSIILLVGGLAIGAITGVSGFSRIEPFFGGLFTGVLTLFLLELGIVAGRRLPDLKRAGFGLVIFGIAFPILAGSLGVLVGQLSHLGVGGSAVLGVLCASASYIAAPAAVRLALPDASPGIYLTASLGITFPFNLTLGIPLMYAISVALEGWGL